MNKTEKKSEASWDRIKTVRFSQRVKKIEEWTDMEGVFHFLSLIYSIFLAYYLNTGVSQGIIQGG